MKHATNANDFRYEARRTHINNNREDVINLELHKVSSNECRIEEVEEAVQAGACIQHATADSNNANSTTKECEIDSVTTTEGKQNIGSESAQMDREGSKRIGAVGRNNTIVSRNTAIMTGEKTAFAEDCIFCLIIQGRSPAYKVSAQYFKPLNQLSRCRIKMVSFCSNHACNNILPGSCIT